MALPVPIFESTWWSVTVPPGWMAEQNEDCATFYHPAGVGALQISAARRETGSVPLQDLQELAAKALPPAIRAKSVKVGALSGLHASYDQDGTHWDRWWLRSDQLLIYVTYNCESAEVGQENAEVLAALASLNSQDAHVTPPN